MVNGILLVLIATNLFINNCVKSNTCYNIITVITHCSFVWEGELKRKSAITDGVVDEVLQ